MAASIASETKRDQRTISRREANEANPRSISAFGTSITRVVEQRMRRLVWTPDDAVVTSILWGWPSDTCVVATRVEHMQWLSGSLPMSRYTPPPIT